MAKRGRPPKTLSELYRTGTFRWDRHGHLVKRPRLDEEGQAVALELAQAGVPLHAVAGRLETTLGAVIGAMRRAGHPVTVPSRAAPAPAQNGRWKGDDAGKVAKHLWLNKYYPRTGTCEECGLNVGTDFPGGTQYAFLRHPEPYTREREDYRELCPQCHGRFDMLLRRAP